MARVVEFLNQYSKGTRHTYRSGIYSFLSFIYGYQRNSESQRLSDEDKRQFDLLSEKYLLEKRDPEKDLINFSVYCSETRAPTAGRLYVSIVKQFFVYCDIDLTKKQEKNLKRKMVAGGTITEEADLTKEKIRQLLNVCDVRLKALVLVLLSSGMRIGEVLNLYDDDISISNDGSYGIVSLRGVSLKRDSRLKNRHSRTTFINKETVEVLHQYLPQRKKYIEQSVKKSRGRWQVEDINDGRIFPVGMAAASASLRAALKRANLFRQDRETKRADIHFHLFRKYFITSLTNSGIPDKFVDFFAGHLGDLDRAYQKQTKDQLLSVYLRGEPYLRIYDESFEEIAKTKEEIRLANEGMQDIRIQNLEMKERIRDLERIIKAKETLIGVQQRPMTDEDRSAIARMVADEMKKVKKS